MACSRIHWRAFSRFPAAIRLEFDWLLASAALVPSLANDALEWCDEEDDDWRPHRAGLSDARKDVVFDEAPENRDRELDDGVFRPDDDPSVVALLISSCMTDEVVDEEPDEPAMLEPLASEWDPLPEVPASSWRDFDLELLWDFRFGGTFRFKMSETFSCPGL